MARAGLGAVAPLGPVARVHRRRAGRPRRDTRGSGTSLGATRAVWRTRPWPSHRHGGTSERRPRGGGGRLTEASNHASYRARMIKIRARAGCSPRAEALVSRSNGGGARFDEATVADSGCARKRSSERGPYAIGRKRAH
jgi:hypothetical protein